jgi:hypothetical protein
MKTKILILLILFFTACSHKSSQDPMAYSPSLIVPAKPINIAYSKWKGTDQVSYEYLEAYPASALLGYINNELKQLDWQPIEYDILNPNIPSSHIKGWGNFVDSSSKTHYIVYQWLAQWKNRNDDVVFYALQYKRKITISKDINDYLNKTDDLSNVSVTISYYPKVLISKMLKSLNK